MASLTNGFDTSLSSSLFAGGGDKAFSDKVLAKQEVDEIKELMSKEDLTRRDLLRLLYLLSGNEIKLVNFGAFERYLSGKLFAWLREFVALAERIGDYKETLTTDKELGEKPGYNYVDEEVIQLVNNLWNQVTHQVKFLCDIFFYLNRSTLSLGATGFDTLTTSRYEYAYNGQAIPNLPDPAKKNSFFSTSK